MLKNESRRNQRFQDFGRVENRNICSIYGTLNDISLNGMKVTYNAPVSLDMENQYEISVRLSKFSSEPLNLLVEPAWKFQRNGSFQIGFEILRSADTHRLTEYIDYLKSASEESEENAVESLYV